MNKPKPPPIIEYIEVPEKKPVGKVDLAFNILFEEVMKDRKIKKKAGNQHQIPTIQA